MDDDGSALRVGAKYKSFTDLECALKIFQQDNYVQLYKRSSRKLGTGSKYKNMEVCPWKLATSHSFVALDIGIMTFSIKNKLKKRVVWDVIIWCAWSSSTRVRYCRHFASAVCKLLHLNFSETTWSIGVWEEYEIYCWIF